MAGRLSRARLVAVVLALVVLAAALAVEVTVRGFGFPDGHLTALERAYRARWSWGRVLALALGANHVALAVSARRRPVRGWLIVSAAATVALALGAAWIAVDLAGRLEDGGGG